MKITLALVALCAFVAYVSAGAYHNGPCYITGLPRVHHIKTAQPHMYLSAADLPANFDYRNISEISMVTMNRNQHLPQYCGSCWAFATTAVLGDRIKIARQGAWPDKNIAPQVLLNCGNAGTCSGGSPSDAFEYMRTTGLPDETCAPYEATDLQCQPENVCKNCQPDMSDPTAECSAVTNPALNFVDEHGAVSGEQNMMAEIYARGPIVCGVSVTPAFEAYKGGIFVDTTNSTAIDHAISVAGWGIEGTVPYWVVRNSWGTPWGENGWAKVARGTNTLGIEEDCSWATPKI